MARDANHLRAKKSLGQHFLVDAHYISRIAESVVSNQPHPFVLEIGPGTGNLTAAIIERIQQTPIIAVEKDVRAFEVLRDRFGHRTPALQEGDALTFDFNELPEGRGVIAGNLPYNVGTGIFIRSLRAGAHFKKAVFMFQAEVARRITAAPSTSAYGSLSVFAQMWGTHQLMMTLPPGAFSPPPKVDSAVIVSQISESPLLAITSQEVDAFESFVRGAFQHRRKTMAKSLSLTGHSRQKVQEAIQQCGFKDKIRAEALSPAELAAVWNEFNGREP